MVSFRSLLTACAAAASVKALPAADQPQAVEARDIASPAAGPYFWSFWKEGNGNFRCNNGAGGSYTATWSGRGGFVCGKGWSPGGSR